jgi:hypothetical protein
LAFRQLRLGVEAVSLALTPGIHVLSSKQIRRILRIRP